MLRTCGISDIRMQKVSRMKVFLATLLLGLVALATSFPQLGEHNHHGHVDIDYHAPAHYKFDYSVHDPHTGDVKSQWEHRDGDNVKGSYTIHDPDGSLRTVEYHADKHNGFNAIVKKHGHSHHPHVYGHKDNV
ncbi:cuticle protein 19-like isoform X2 [Cimex lectularius]|uniref:CPR type cuticle protein n=1 Tax=Cimex lectularius TaxID=79782 RepID=A0A8I6RRR0_CIMLE|nr:cuticle protein 19-like isoform X2 [Cimex lectularius]